MKRLVCSKTPPQTLNYFGLDGEDLENIWTVNYQVEGLSEVLITLLLPSGAQKGSAHLLGQVFSKLKQTPTGQNLIGGCKAVYRLPLRQNLFLESPLKAPCNPEAL